VLKVAILKVSGLILPRSDFECVLYRLANLPFTSPASSPPLQPLTHNRQNTNSQGGNHLRIWCRVWTGSSCPLLLRRVCMDQCRFSLL